MAQVHNLIHISDWHKKAKSFPSGDVFVIYKVVPGKNHTHIIYEVNLTEEHPFIEHASCPNEVIALYLAQMLFVHLKRKGEPEPEPEHKPDADGDPIGLNKALAIARRHSGPLHLDPISEDEPFSEHVKAFLNKDTVTKGE